MNHSKDVLDTIIRERGKTYVELADGLGVSRETFWRYRRDPSRMRGPQLEKLADLLDMPVSELMKLINV